MCDVYIAHITQIVISGVREFETTKAPETQKRIMQRLASSIIKQATPGLQSQIYTFLTVLIQTSYNAVVFSLAHLFILVPVGCVALLGADLDCCAADNGAYISEHLLRQAASFGNVTHNQLQTSP